MHLNFELNEASMHDHERNASTHCSVLRPTHQNAPSTVPLCSFCCCTGYAGPTLIHGFIGEIMQSASRQDRMTQQHAQQCDC